MKSRHRQPLHFNDPDPQPTEAADPATAESAAEPAPPAVPPVRAERPMSERRRRRLAEQQAAETASKAAAEPAREALPDEGGAAQPTLAQAEPVLARSAEAPPARYEAPPPPAPAPASIPEPSAQTPYLLAGLAALLWVGGVAAWAAYEFGAGAEPLEPLRLAIYALLALAPAGLALLLANAMRQGAGLAAETRRARALAEALAAPTALAARQAGDALTGLRADIDQAQLAAERARHDMALLREALAQETVRLNEAAETAGRTARKLAEQLGGERAQMADLSGKLEGQTAGVIDAVERQSRMVADASDLAQTQLREAEAALAARAADLAAAAAEAQDAARVAADDLARQTLRLENAGSGVAEQIQSVEEGLGQQRAALVTAAYALRTDQEDFSAQVESQRAQLTEQLSAARAAAMELGQTSERTTESVKDLVEAATDQFRALVEVARREADGFDGATKEALDRFEAMAAEARDVLIEETRRALAAMQATAEESRALAGDAANQAQLRADRLGEALFEAAQQADQAAEARIQGARRIVAETAGLVDQAGEDALARMETVLERMQAALRGVDAAVAAVDERAARLPDEAQARVAAVQTAVEQGLEALSAASRKAAEDTEALDASFQERVRRNYDMLTEAVRLMGVVSGDSAPARRREPAPPPEPAPAPPPEPRPGRSDAGRGFGLRGRLKLESLPETPPRPPAAARDDRIGWRELVGDNDVEPLELSATAPAAAAPDPGEDADVLADRLTAAIRRMGVDPNALLPRPRVEEAAEAWGAGDAARARQVVRRVAPAAVRSLSRRVLSDPATRADAERYVKLMAVELSPGGAGGDPARALARLATDSGRAFMLLDAAVGDMG